MKRVVKDADSLKVTMYVRPIIYTISNIAASVQWDDKNRRYHTDINPSRIINGPLSGPGEDLESPLKDEWDAFIEDCKFVIKEAGFTIIKSKRSEDSGKSEYVVTYGVDDTPCGTIVHNIRLSDHPLDATFPEELKDQALEFLHSHDILDEAITKAGIDFQVEKVTVGSVKCDTWDRAILRLYNILKRMRRIIQIRLNRDRRI